MAAILIVDDERRVLDSLAALLSAHTVYTAATAEGGRKLWVEHKQTIDFVILDGFLHHSDPEPTTQKLAKEIRASGFAGPIVCMSTDSGMRAKLRECGCDHGIHKNNAGRLLELIEQTTQQKIKPLDGS